MPKPNHPPAFQFYPQDFASDSKVEAMTTDAVGAYILLLCKAWREDPPGSLPDDDDVLSRWARLPLARWTEIRSAVLAPFTFGIDSRWHQKRMRREYSELIKRRKVRAIAGQAGASVRWQTHSKRSGLPMARNEGEGEVPPLIRKKECDLPPILDTENFRAALDRWLRYKAERREAYKPVGLQAMVARAAKLATEHSVDAVIEAMERAAGNRWAGWDQRGAFERAGLGGKSADDPRGNFATAKRYMEDQVDE